MRNSFILIFTFLFIASGSLAGDGNKYGKEIALKTKTQISEILKNPQEFVGKNVLVEGLVLDVCGNMGCWIELESDEPDQKIKVKVKDGEIVFPIEEKGKTALVEGQVYEIKMTKEQAIESAKHEAEEHGREFDPESITGPVTKYQIKGIGAVIK